MISAVVASLFSSNSRNSLPSRSTSSSIICGKVAMSCVLRSCLANELVQQHARDHVERLKHAFALVRRGAEGGAGEHGLQREAAAGSRLAPCSTTAFPTFTGQPLNPHRIGSKIQINDSCGSEVAASHHVPAVSPAHRDR